MISFSRSQLIFLLLFSIISSVIIGIIVANVGVNFQLILYFVFAFILVILLAQGTRTLKIGFIIWIWMFNIGYRTIHLTSYLSIHPLIVFLTVMFLFLLFRVKENAGFQFKFPKLLLFFIPFWFWGFIPGLINGIPFTNMIADSMNFYFLIPLFMIILYLSKEIGFWKSSLMSFLGAGTLICFLGSLEYFVPGIRNLIPGFIHSDQSGYLSQSGFFRANFSIFGQTAAVIISALSIPMVSLIPRYRKGFIGKILMMVCLAILGLGIYISGTRDAWIMVVVTSLLLAYFGIGFLGVGLTGGFWLIVYHFLPSDALSLISTLSTPLSTGQILDTSLNKRVDLQLNAIQLMTQNPLGVGWSGSGWVHGDFTQVAANLGIIAGIVFLAWYLHTLYRGWKYYRKNPKDWLFQSLLTSFILCGIVLATEGVQVLTQFIMPVWFVWGLIEAYMQQKKIIIPNSTAEK